MFLVSVEGVSVVYLCRVILWPFHVTFSCAHLCMLLVKYSTYMEAQFFFSGAKFNSR